MKFLYSFSIYCYTFIIHLASFFNPKAKLWVEGRRNWTKKLPDVTNRKVIWFHCASLGEFDQALPLMNLIKRNHPDFFVLVTFFSPSGFQHFHKRNHTADHVCYLPADTPSNAKKFIQHYQPTLTFFVKYEFWANYIFALKKTTGKLFSVSAIFRENQRFFKPNATFFPAILKQFDGFFVQNSDSKTLLATLNIDAEITGDTRFDKVIENKEKLEPNAIIEQLFNNEKAIVIGSSWPADEEILYPIINQSTERFIIAPHQIDEAHILSISQNITRKKVRYTELINNPTIQADVLILDTIGHLASAYFYGKIAYVGGGFSGSLHNILEPGVFGLPVLFGPKHNRFPEAQFFIDQGIGFSVSNTSEISEKIIFIENHLTELKSKTTEFVEEQKGATDKIYNYLKTNKLV